MTVQRARRVAPHSQLYPAMRWTDARRVREALKKILSMNRWRPPHNDGPVETPEFDPPGPMHASHPAGLPLPERPSYL